MQTRVQSPGFAAGRRLIVTGSQLSMRHHLGNRAARTLLALTLWTLALGTAGDSALGSVCDNERLRILQASEGLPDCRAYEQVTPLDKGGFDATGTVPFVKAAPGGGGITYLSSASSDPFLEYTPTLAVRSLDAWSNDALFPSLQFGGVPEVVGSTPDLSETFVRVNDPKKGASTAFLARSADGALTTIVPFTADLSPRFVGASADRSLVVFESPVALPGSGPAISGKPNLYAWQRASGSVRLIGVFNDGRPPLEGAFGGSYDWVRGTTPATLAEGGASRDYYTQDQHVVAADGSAVYFTAAGTGQLYLRRNPGAAQSPLNGTGGCADPNLACTIRVSVTRKANGAGAGGSDPVGPRPAAFIGASAGGTRVLFTSTEELTDDANTGSEPSSVRISRAGIDGDPASIEPDFLPTAAAGIAVDGSHLYWANPARGSIGRAGVDGTGLDEDFVTGLVNPRWVAVDGEYVYWTSPGPAAQPDGGAIGRVRLDGGAAPEPNFITAVNQPQGIAVDDSRVYWANGGTHAIARANIDGSGAEPSFIFLGNSQTPQSVAVDGTHLYWAGSRPLDGFIARSNLDGSSEISKLIGGFDELRGIAVDGGHVYWAVTSGAIGRAGLDLGDVQAQFISSAGRAVGLALDGLHIHWSAGGREANPGNDLYRYDVDLEELTDLTPTPGEVNGAGVVGVLGISQDASHVYFAANGVLTSEPNSNGEMPLPGTCAGTLATASGSCNLYLSRGGTIDFVARLQIDGAAESDAANWSATPAGVYPSTSFQKTARVSADGRTLLFRSRRQLTDYANEGIPQIYRYHVDAGLACISCNPTGAAPVGAPTFGTIATPTLLSRSTALTLIRNLSATGDRVFFESVDPLVAADGNGSDGCPRIGFPAQEFPACQDVYEWEAEGTGSCESAAANGGCLYLLSNGQKGQPAFFADASEDGEDAFLFTGAPLVRQDRDELVDVYDARVDGGLAAQSEAPAACRGEECRGPWGGGAQPAVEAPATAAPARRGRRRPGRRCSKAKRAVRGPRARRGCRKRR
jgi:WD40-like Beta Propeller Repeat